MTGCQTCGGYGNRHDPVAHGTVRELPDWFLMDVIEADEDELVLTDLDAENDG